MTERVVLLVVLAGLAAAMLWSQLAFARWLAAWRVNRRRVICPGAESDAIVDFLVDAEGPEVYRDVVDCSLVRGRPAGCGRVCRSTSVAPFGMPAD